jgi:hypothetical protein
MELEGRKIISHPKARCTPLVLAAQVLEEARAGKIKGLVVVTTTSEGDTVEVNWTAMPVERAIYMATVLRLEAETMIDTKATSTSELLEGA